MKKFYIILIALAITFGCAAPNVPVNTTLPTTHRVEVGVVRGADALMVKCHEEDKKGMLEPSQLLMLTDSRAFIKLFAGLSVADTTRMENDFLFLQELTNIRDVTILINSPGGSAFDGLAMADIIRHYREKGWTVRTQARGIVASAAVPVFAAGSPRSAAKATIFMVHEAALWKWPGRETASDIRAQNELMGLLRERYLDILVNNSNLNEHEWLLMEIKTSWFSAEKGREFGIVDEIN
jgi:ATP-dependent protease ClpP protease subunit